MRNDNICPHCGEPVPADAISCRHCGSDAETGWGSEEEISYQSVDLPESWPPGPVRSRFGPRFVRFGVFAVLLAMLAWILYRIL
jgi:hypothetical protein